MRLRIKEKTTLKLKLFGFGKENEFKYYKNYREIKKSICLLPIELFNLPIDMHIKINTSIFNKSIFLKLLIRLLKNTQKFKRNDPEYTYIKKKIKSKYKVIKKDLDKPATDKSMYLAAYWRSIKKKYKILFKYEKRKFCILKKQKRTIFKKKRIKNPYRKKFIQFDSSDEQIIIL